MVETLKQQAQRLLGDVPQEQAFWVNDGCVVRNLKELNEEFKHMSNDIYIYHANGEKNDFATWIKDVYGDEVLAANLRAAMNKEQAARAVASRTNILSKRLT
jgi:hypothetical protein